jgi:ribose 5-phosphate isomerase B
VRVYLAADHAGYELKNHLVSWLKDRGHDVVDEGAFVDDAEDD